MSMIQPSALPSVSEIVIEVSRESDTLLAQTKAIALAMSAGCSSLQSWEYSVAVNEAASNVFKHAGRGTIELRLRRRESLCLELEAHDQGPGIGGLHDMSGPDVLGTGEILRRWEAMARRRPNQGLGAIRRLMDELEISSEPYRGTVVRARKHL